MDEIQQACLLNSAACFLACRELDETLDCCYQASPLRASICSSVCLSVFALYIAYFFLSLGALARHAVDMILLAKKFLRHPVQRAVYEYGEAMLGTHKNFDHQPR